MTQTQENSQKPHFRPDLGPLGPKSDHRIFFQKSGYVCQGQLSPSKISEKTNDPIFSDGWTDGQTNRRTRVTS